VTPASATTGIQIADTGFYQVTFGVGTVAEGTIWGLSLNGAAVTAQNTLQTAITSGGGVTTGVMSMTVIINATVNPTTVRIFSVSGAATVNSPGAVATAVAAYMTIIKLL
jgi:hypothetical protein